MRRSTAPESDDTGLSFARHAVEGLAAIPPDERRDSELLFLLHLSTWIASTRVELPEACQALISARDVVIEAGGLDRSCEPVPLIVGDLRVAVASVAVYLGVLIDRAAARAGCGAAELARRSLALF